MNQPVERKRSFGVLLAFYWQYKILLTAASVTSPDYFSPHVCFHNFACAFHAAFFPTPEKEGVLRFFVPPSRADAVTAELEQINKHLFRNVTNVLDVFDQKQKDFHPQL